MADAPAPTASKGGTVKLPGLGPVNKKALGVAALVGGGILVFAYMRKRKAGGGTSAAATAGTTDPNVDPATGFDYGTPQDIAALNANTGSAGLGAGSGIGLGAGGGGGGFFDPNTGQFDLSSPFTGGGTTTVTTNAQWEQQAIADLEAGGVSQHTISDAESGLPRYLAHLTLSPGQASAVQMAVGLAGPPPSGGPFAIRIAHDRPKPKTAMVTVPKVTGKSYTAAAAELTAHGLHAHRAAPDVGIVEMQDPAAGAHVHEGAIVVLSGKPARR